MPERTDPTNIANHPFYCQYLAGYKYAQSFVTDLRVLDTGCGEGYGAELLAQRAREVIAIDRDKKTIRKAKQRYWQSNLQFNVCDINNLSSYPPRSFDVVCCFHTIEHLKYPKHFLQEVRKLLSDSGLFLVSTPNRKNTFVDWPYHEREYDAEEFQELLSTCFENVTLHALHASQNMLQFRDIQERTVQQLFKWDILQLHRWLPKRFLQVGFDIGGWLLKAWLRMVYANSISHITIKDFHVMNKELDKGLDLIGICRNTWK